MYPEDELTRLARHKVMLRRRIARHRAQCAEATLHVARPLEWLDRLLVVWRKISPLAQFAAVPLGFLVQRTLFPKRKLLGTLFRWVPIVFSTVRSLGSAGIKR